MVDGFDSEGCRREKRMKNKREKCECDGGWSRFFAIEKGKREGNMEGLWRGECDVLRKF
jgi:hypothetical protein